MDENGALSDSLGSPQSDEDEVYFGPLTEKEKRKIALYANRKTEIFLPGFRQLLTPFNGQEYQLDESCEEGTHANFDRIHKLNHSSDVGSDSSCGITDFINDSLLLDDQFTVCSNQSGASHLLTESSQCSCESPDKDCTIVEYLKNTPPDCFMNSVQNIKKKASLEKNFTEEAELQSRINQSRDSFQNDHDGLHIETCKNEEICLETLDQCNSDRVKLEMGKAVDECHTLNFNFVDSLKKPCFMLYKDYLNNSVGNCLDYSFDKQTELKYQKTFARSPVQEPKVCVSNVYHEMDLSDEDNSNSCIRELKSKSISCELINNDSIVNAEGKNLKESKFHKMIIGKIEDTLQDLNNMLEDIDVSSSVNDVLEEYYNTQFAAPNTASDNLQETESHMPHSNMQGDSDSLPECIFINSSADDCNEITELKNNEIIDLKFALDDKLDKLNSVQIGKSLNEIHDNLDMSLLKKNCIKSEMNFRNLTSNESELQHCTDITKENDNKLSLFQMTFSYNPVEKDSFVNKIRRPNLHTNTCSEEIRVHNLSGVSENSFEDEMSFLINSVLLEDALYNAHESKTTLTDALDLQSSYKQKCSNVNKVKSSLIPLDLCIRHGSNKSVTYSVLEEVVKENIPPKCLLGLRNRYDYSNYDSEVQKEGELTKIQQKDNLFMHNSYTKGSTMQVNNYQQVMKSKIPCRSIESSFEKTYQMKPLFKSESFKTCDQNFERKIHRQNSCRSPLKNLRTFPANVMSAPSKLGLELSTKNKVTPFKKGATSKLVHTIPSKDTAGFKIPDLYRNKKDVPVKTPKKKLTPKKVWNVMSPVAKYIQDSPTPPLVRTVRPTRQIIVYSQDEEKDKSVFERCACNSNSTSNKSSENGQTADLPTPLPVVNYRSTSRSVHNIDDDQKQLVSNLNTVRNKCQMKLFPTPNSLKIMRHRGISKTISEANTISEERSNIFSTPLMGISNPKETMANKLEMSIAEPVNVHHTNTLH